MKRSIYIINYILLSTASLFAQIDTAWISYNLFPEANITTATVVKADQIGNIYAAGSIYSYSLPYENIFIIKYNAEGEIVWLQTYGSEDTTSFEPNTLCLDSDGNAYITFMKHCINSTTNYWAIAVQKYNASDGTLLWTSELPNSQFNAFEWQVKPKYMTIDNNHLYVAGTKFESGIPGSEMLSMKVDFNGNILWTATHSGSGTNANSKGITVDESGNVYMVGDAWNSSIDYAIVKLNPEGGLIWEAFLDGDIYNNTDIAQSVLVDEDGNVYVTGYNQISSNLTDIVTAKYDQNGGFLWKHNYGNPEHRDHNAYYLGMGNDGNLIVGGYSAYEDPFPGTGKDYLVLKYNPSGDLLWDARFDHFNYYNDHPFDFDMDTDGNVYACGISVKSCYPNEFITTVKYNPQGEEVWVFSIPETYGIPWSIDVMGNDEFVFSGAAMDSNLVKHTATIKCVPGPPFPYGNDILEIVFEQQIAPPIIDPENHTITAFVNDNVNLQYLVPNIDISDNACMYPADGDTTSFIEPVWYNVTSFNNVEQWWIVHVAGGTIGQEENEFDDFVIYPNPVKDIFTVQQSKFKDKYAQIELYDMFGNCVAKLLEGKSFSGQIEVDVKEFPSGIFYCTIYVGKKSCTKKIVLVK